MKKLLVGITISLSLSVLLSAQANQLSDQVVTAFAHETVVFSTISKALTASVYNPVVADAPSVNTRASVSTIDCDDNGSAAPDNQIRAWYDGTAPTASVGVTFIPSISRVIYGYGNIAGFRGIRKGAADVTCQIHYYRVINNAS